MSMFNAFTLLKGKRLYDDLNQDQSTKKQRVQDESTNDTSSSSTQSALDRQKTSEAARNQVNKMLMTFVQNQSSIEIVDHIPKAQLRENLYSSPLIDHIMDMNEYDYDERQVWSLAALLFNVNGDASQHQLHRRLKNWLRSTVLEEMQRERRRLDMIQQQEVEDDGGWQRAFHYMSSGQVVQAVELVQQLGDDALVTMMVVHFQEDGQDIHAAARQQVLFWQQQGRFDTLPLYQRKMWYVLQGRLGYVDDIKSIVTQDLPWQQAFLLYILYGDCHSDFVSAFTAYNSVTTTAQNVALNGGNVGLHYLRTRKHTASVPDRCLWYILLQWWVSYAQVSNDADLSSYRKSLENKLPIRCRWLLLLHQPKLFSNEPDVLEIWKDQWCEELYQHGLEYMSILAGLFMASPDAKIKELLSKREWDKEHYIVRQLQIPQEWVAESKILHAHNHRLYDKEVDYCLETGQVEKARDTILNYLIPAVFLDNEQNDVTITYLRRLIELFPDDTQLQQTTSILRNIHTILRDFPHLIGEPTSTPAQLETMENELNSALQSISILSKMGNMRDFSFFSKIAGQLIIVGSKFMNTDQLNTLLERSPVHLQGNPYMMEALSHAMVARIAK